MTNIAIADPSTGLRGWLRVAISRPKTRITEVESGWELLLHLAETPCDLVIIGPRLPDLPGVGLLAMARTVGLDTPFLLVIPFCRPSVRAAIFRLGGGEIVEDWSDTPAIRDSVERLCSKGLRPPLSTKLTAELGIVARRLVHRSVARARG